MPDLSDLLKDAVGEIPAFDAGSLVAKLRHRRQLQAAGAASTAAAVALFVGVAFNHDSGGRVAIKTRADVTDAPPTTDSSTSTAPIGSTTTSAPPVDTTGEGTTTIPGMRAPEPGDFTGTLTLSSTTVRVGEGVDMELRIHNASGVAIDTSQHAYPTTLALYCDTVLNPGPPGNGGAVYRDAWYLTSPTMQPGADALLTARFEPTSDLVGRVGCQAVIVSPAIPRFFPTWDVVTAIPAVVVTVSPADTAATTTTTTTAAPSTTVPTT